MTHEQEALRAAENELADMENKLTAARERLAQAIPARAEAMQAAIKNPDPKLANAFTKASNDLTFASEEVKALEDFKSRAQQRVDERKSDIARANESRVSDRRLAAVRRILTIETDVQSHAAATAELRKQQQKIFDEEVVPLNPREDEKWLRHSVYFTSLHEVLHDGVDRVMSDARAQGATRGPMFPMAEGFEALPAPATAKMLSDDGGTKTVDGLLGFTPFDPSDMPSNARAFTKGNPYSLTADEKHQLLHIIETCGVGTCDAVDMREVGLQLGQLYTLAGQSWRSRDTVTANQAEVTPQIVSKIRSGLRRGLAICAGNGKPYKARQSKTVDDEVATVDTTATTTGQQRA